MDYLSLIIRRSRSRKFYLKLISAGLILSFLGQDLLMAAPDGLASVATPPSFLNHLQLPDSVATIRERYTAPQMGRTILLIQDAHTNESAQLNIAKAIDHILVKEQKIKHVFLEAGTGNDSLSYLRRFSSLEKREKVARSFLRRGLIQGPDYLDLTSDKAFSLWGVENKKLYWEGLALYRDLKKDRPLLEAGVDRLKRAKKTLATRLWSPALQKMDSGRESFLRGELGAADYFDALVMEARKLGVPLEVFPHLSKLTVLKNQEKEIDFKKASLEEAALVASLPESERTSLLVVAAKLRQKDAQNHREVQDAFYSLLKEKIKNPLFYVHLSKYIEYLVNSRGFDAEVVLKEREDLEKIVFGQLAGSRDSRRLLEAARAVEILERLWQLEISKEDFEAIQKNPGAHSFLNLAGFFNLKLIELGSHTEDTVLWDEKFGTDYDKAIKFYSLTLERDEAFVTNMLKKMDASGEKKAILVTGGFHTEHLKDLFRARGISYAVVIPRILQETNKEKYESLLLGQIKKNSSKIKNSAKADAWAIIPPAENRQIRIQLSEGVGRGLAAARLASAKLGGKHRVSYDETLKKDKLGKKLREIFDRSRVKQRFFLEQIDLALSVKGDSDVRIGSITSLHTNFFGGMASYKTLERVVSVAERINWSQLSKKIEGSERPVRRPTVAESIESLTAVQKRELIEKRKQSPNGQLLIKEVAHVLGVTSRALGIFFKKNPSVHKAFLEANPIAARLAQQFKLDINPGKSFWFHDRRSGKVFQVRLESIDTIHRQIQLQVSENDKPIDDWGGIEAKTYGSDTPHKIFPGVDDISIVFGDTLTNSRVGLFFPHFPFTVNLRRRNTEDQPASITAFMAETRRQQVLDAWEKYLKGVEDYYLSDSPPAANEVSTALEKWINNSFRSPDAAVEPDPEATVSSMRQALTERTRLSRENIDNEIQDARLIMIEITKPISEKEIAVSSVGRSEGRFELVNGVLGQQKKALREALKAYFLSHSLPAEDADAVANTLVRMTPDGIKLLIRWGILSGIPDEQSLENENLFNKIKPLITVYDQKYPDKKELLLKYLLPESILELMAQHGLDRERFFRILKLHPSPIIVLLRLIDEHPRVDLGVIEKKVIQLRPKTPISEQNLWRIIALVGTEEAAAWILKKTKDVSALAASIYIDKAWDQIIREEELQGARLALGSSVSLNELMIEGTKAIFEKLRDLGVEHVDYAPALDVDQVADLLDRISSTGFSLRAKITPRLAVITSGKGPAYIFKIQNDEMKFIGVIELDPAEGRLGLYSMRNEDRLLADGIGLEGHRVTLYEITASELRPLFRSDEKSFSNENLDRQVTDNLTQNTFTLIAGQDQKTYSLVDGSQVVTASNIIDESALAHEMMKEIAVNHAIEVRQFLDYREDEFRQKLIAAIYYLKTGVKDGLTSDRIKMAINAYMGVVQSLSDDPSETPANDLVEEAGPVLWYALKFAALHNNLRISRNSTEYFYFQSFTNGFIKAFASASRRQDFPRIQEQQLERAWNLYTGLADQLIEQNNANYFETVEMIADGVEHLFQNRVARLARSTRPTIRRDLLRAGDYAQFEDSDHPVFITSYESPGELKSQRIVYVNPAFLKMVGGEKEDWIGKNYFEKNQRELAEKYTRDDKNAMNMGPGQFFHETETNRSGQNRQKPVTVETVKLPFYNDRGQWVGVLAMFDVIQGEQSSYEMNPSLQRTLIRVLRQQQQLGVGRQPRLARLGILEPINKPAIGVGVLAFLATLTVSSLIPALLIGFLSALAMVGIQSAVLLNEVKDTTLEFVLRNQILYQRQTRIANTDIQQHFAARVKSALDFLLNLTPPTLETRLLGKLSAPSMGWKNFPEFLSENRAAVERAVVRRGLKHLKAREGVAVGARMAGNFEEFSKRIHEIVRQEFGFDDFYLPDTTMARLHQLYLDRFSERESVEDFVTHILRAIRRDIRHARRRKKAKEAGFNAETLLKVFNTFATRAGEPKDDGDRYQEIPSKVHLPESHPSDFIILVPLFNEQKKKPGDVRRTGREQDLVEYIRRIRNAGYLDRVIFVNDGSTDFSQEVLESNPDTFFIQFQKNQEKEGSLVSALRFLKEHYQDSGERFPEYFAAVDADTYLESGRRGSNVPEAMKKVIRLLEKKNAVAVSMNIQAHLEPGVPTLAEWMQAMEWNTLGPQYVLRMLLATPAIPGGGTVYNTQAFLAAMSQSTGGFENRPLELREIFQKQGRKLLYPTKLLTARTEIFRSTAQYMKERKKWAEAVSMQYGWGYELAVLAFNLFIFYQFFKAEFTEVVKGVVLILQLALPWFFARVFAYYVYQAILFVNHLSQKHIFKQNVFFEAPAFNVYTFEIIPLFFIYSSFVTITALKVANEVVIRNNVGRIRHAFKGARLASEDLSQWTTEIPSFDYRVLPIQTTFFPGKNIQKLSDLMEDSESKRSLKIYVEGEFKGQSDEDFYQFAKKRLHLWVDGVEEKIDLDHVSPQRLKKFFVDLHGQIYPEAPDSPFVHRLNKATAILVSTLLVLFFGSMGVVQALVAKPVLRNAFFAIIAAIPLTTIGLAAFKIFSFGRSLRWAIHYFYLGKHLEAKSRRENVRQIVRQFTEEAFFGARLAEDSPIQAVEGPVTKNFISPIEYGKKVSGTFMPFHHMRHLRDWGIGNFESAIKMAGVFKKLGLKIMQILPLIWSDAFNSPYSEASSRAIDLRYISVPMLVDQLTQEFGDKIEFSKYKEFLAENKSQIEAVRTGDVINHEEVIRLNKEALEAIWENLSHSPEFENSHTFKAFEKFKLANDDWLEDHMLYLLLKEENMARDPYNGWDWRTWVDASGDEAESLKIRQRDPAKIDALKKDRRYSSRIALYSYIQFVAYSQYDEFVAEAKKQGVDVAVDVPFARGGADIWMNPEIFGLRQENGYQRPFTHGSLPEETYNIGQYWQFFAYDWKQLGTLKYMLELFEHYQKMAPYIRIDHALGFYMPYLFMEDGKGEFTLQKLGIFEDVKNIVQAAKAEIAGDGSRTDEIKERAAREVTTIFIRALKNSSQVKANPLVERLVNLAYRDDTEKLSEYAMMYVAREAKKTNEEYETLGDPWVRVNDVVEAKVFDEGEKRRPVWNYIRLTKHEFGKKDPNDHNPNEKERRDYKNGMIEYLFGGEEPKPEDNLRVAAYDKGPGEEFLSPLLKLARQKGTTVISEALARFIPDGLEKPHLSTYDYVCSMWGKEKEGADKNIHNPRAHQPYAFRTYSLHDTKALRGDWKEATPEKKTQILNDLGISPTEENLSDLTPQVRKALLKLSFDSDSLMVVIGWLDILGYDNDRKLNKPGETGHWKNRLLVSAEILDTVLDGKTEIGGEPISEDVRTAVNDLRELNAEREASSQRELSEKIERTLIRHSPDIDNHRIEVEQFRDGANTQIEPFLIESYVSSAAKKVTVKIRYRDNAGQIQENEFSMVQDTQASTPEGISRYSIALKAGQVGEFEFQIEAKDESGSTISSEKGYLYAVAHREGLNPTSGDYFMKKREYSSLRSVAAARLSSKLKKGSPTMPGLIFVANLMDFGAELVNGRWDYRDSLKNLQQILPVLKEAGIIRVYLFGPYQTSKLSADLHSKPGLRAIHDQAATVIAGYGTKESVVGGTSLKHEFGNIFSIDDLLRINQKFPPDDFDSLIRKGKELGMEFMTDLIPWRSPGGVNKDNYRQTFYQELKDEENREFREQPETEKDSWIAQWLEKKAQEKDLRAEGVAAVRIKEEGRLERVIFVERLYFYGMHSGDQVILNPFLPSTREYYLKAIQSWVDQGLFEFRVDLGHLLLKRNIRGVFENLRRKGVQLELWLAQIGADIRPGETFEAWFDRQSELWAEVVAAANAYSLKTKGVAVRFHTETYDRGEQNELFAQGVDASYWEEPFKVLSQRTENGGSQWQAHGLHAPVWEALHQRPALTVFPLGNFDQNWFLKYMREAWEAGAQLTINLAYLGVPTLVSLETLILAAGSVIPVVDHKQIDDSDFSKRKDFAALSEAIQRSPFLALLKKFSKKVRKPVNRYTEVRLFNSDRNDRYFTIGWRDEEGNWILSLINFKPEEDLRDQKEIIGIELPDEYQVADSTDFRKIVPKAKNLVTGKPLELSRWNPYDKFSRRTVNIVLDSKKERGAKHHLILLKRTAPLPVTKGSKDPLKKAQALLTVQYPAQRWENLLEILTNPFYTSVREEAVLFMFLDEQQRVRGSVANLSAERFRDVRLEISVPKLLEHIQNPLLSIGSFPGGPKMPETVRYDPVHARRNKRYAILWALGKLSAPAATRDVAFQDRARELIRETLQHDATSWNAENSEALTSLLGRVSPEWIVGEPENISLLEILRLVIARARKLQDQKDKFYWVQSAVREIYPDTPGDLVSDIVYGRDVVAARLSSKTEWKTPEFETDVRALWAALVENDEDGVVDTIAKLHGEGHFIGYTARVLSSSDILSLKPLLARAHVQGATVPIYIRHLFMNGGGRQRGLETERFSLLHRQVQSQSPSWQAVGVGIQNVFQHVIGIESPNPQKKGYALFLTEQNDTFAELSDATPVWVYVIDNGKGMDLHGVLDRGQHAGTTNMGVDLVSLLSKGNVLTRIESQGVGIESGKIYFPPPTGPKTGTLFAVQTTLGELTRKTRKRAAARLTQPSPRDKKVDEMISGIHGIDGHLLELTQIVQKEMKAGLKGKKSSLPMIASSVPVPDLAALVGQRVVYADLGGSTIHIGAIEIGGHQAIRVLWHEDIKLGDNISIGGRKLFDYISQEIAASIKRHQKQGSKDITKMSFTFSFSHQDGKILPKAHGTKGFDFKNIVGRNVKNLVNRRLKKLGVGGLRVVVVANDTEGAMILGNLTLPRVIFSVIAGTGFNTAVWIDGKLYNMESGGLAIPKEWLTPHDLPLVKRGAEELIAGKFLGEQLRVRLLDLAKNDNLFSGSISKKLRTEEGISSKNVSRIYLARSDKKVQSILYGLGIRQVSPRDIQAVRQIAAALFERSYKVNAAIIAGGLSLDPIKTKSPQIAADGALWNIPAYLQGAQRQLRSLAQKLDISGEPKIHQVQNASGVGVGAIAAVVTQAPTGARLAKQLSFDHQAKKMISEIGRMNSRLEVLARKVARHMKLGIDQKKSLLEMIPSATPEPVLSGLVGRSAMYVDLGGSTLHLGAIKIDKMDGAGKIRLLWHKNISLGKNISIGGNKLFDLIADEIQLAMAEHRNNGSKEIRQIGFTFSFPHQDGKILPTATGDKGFDFRDVVGKNIKQIMKDRLVKRGFGNLEVAAVVNDTESALTEGSLIFPNVRVSVIAGTGFNTAVEISGKIYNMESGEMRLPTSWFSTHDIDSGMKKAQDLISARLLGEMLRTRLLALAKNHGLFSGRASVKLNTPFGIPPKAVTRIYTAQNTKQVRSILYGLGVRGVEDQDVRVVQKITQALFERSQKTNASILAGSLLGEGSKTKTQIAADGALWKVPSYIGGVQNELNQLTRALGLPRSKINKVDNSSGIGAAVTALVVTQDKAGARLATSPATPITYGRDLASILANQLGSSKFFPIARMGSNSQIHVEVVFKISDDESKTLNLTLINGVPTHPDPHLVARDFFTKGLDIAESDFDQQEFVLTVDRENQILTIESQGPKENGAWLVENMIQFESSQGLAGKVDELSQNYRVVEELQRNVSYSDCLKSVTDNIDAIERMKKIFGDIFKDSEFSDSRYSTAYELILNAIFYSGNQNVDVNFTKLQASEDSSRNVFKISINQKTSGEREWQRLKSNKRSFDLIGPDHLLGRHERITAGHAQNKAFGLFRLAKSMSYEGVFLRFLRDSNSPFALTTDLFFIGKEKSAARLAHPKRLTSTHLQGPRSKGSSRPALSDIQRFIQRNKDPLKVFTYESRKHRGLFPVEVMQDFDVEFFHVIQRPSGVVELWMRDENNPVVTVTKAEYEAIRLSRRNVSEQEITSEAVKSAITLAKIKTEMDLGPEVDPVVPKVYAIPASLFRGIQDPEKLKTQVYYLAFQILDLRRQKQHQSSIFYLEGLGKDAGSQRVRSIFSEIFGDQPWMQYSKPAQWEGATVQIIDPRHKADEPFVRVPKTLYPSIDLGEDAPPGWNMLFVSMGRAIDFYAERDYQVSDSNEIPSQLFQFYNQHIAEKFSNKGEFWDFLSGNTPGKFSKYVFKLPLLEKVSEKILSYSAQQMFRSLASAA